MAHDRDRENSYGGFQYRWNYDEYQKSLQRKRRKSAARGMRAFCLTAIFVFLICAASLLVVLAASFMRGMVPTLPTASQSDKTPDAVSVLDDGNISVTTEPLAPAPSDTPTTEPAESVPLGPLPSLDDPKSADHDLSGASDPAEPQTNEDPVPSAPAVVQGTLSDEYASSDTKNLFTAMTLSEIAETCSASTVTVQCAASNTFGSGFILAEDGYIVTNYHVISRSDSYQIMLNDGSTYDAQLVGAEPEMDLAVLRIDAEALPVVKVGPSKNAAVGDQVVAIGTPGSVSFAGTVTYGYISGLGRSVEITDDNDNVISFVDMIQITAAINPGNSGGPLFNCFGEVIAINTMKLSGDGIEGMGFAIPIDDVYPILTDHINTHRAQNAPETDDPADKSTPETDQTDAEVQENTTGAAESETEPVIPVERPYAPFGVRCETITQKESQLYKIPVGVILRYIEPNSYAEKNGLRIGDIILSVNDSATPDVAALDSWAQSVRIGDTAEIVIFRAGEEMNISVIFADEVPNTCDTPETEALQETDTEDQTELPNAA